MEIEETLNQEPESRYGGSGCSMLHFHKNYFIAFVVLFITEILIALYAHDQIIRPYVGDVLVVILLYCFIQSFMKIPVIIAALSVLLFSFIIEILQYFNLVKHLGLQHSRLANVVIGNYFTWVDILAYTLGILIVLMIEILRKKPISYRYR
jgi:hypothetical protein